jgi:ribosome biogenesis GTPase
MDLVSLGADMRLYRAFEAHAAQGLAPARVAVAQRDRYRLYTEAGEVDAEPSGALWYRAADPAAMPVVGDWVAARVASADFAIVEAVLPRRTFFSRRASGRREREQPIAANIDLVFVVCGLDGDFNLRRIERYLTVAHESGATAVVVLSKADLSHHLKERIEETAAVAPNTPVLAASALQDGGVDGLKAFFAPGRTVALVGSSGVGKSTLVNRILGEERMRTSEVRLSDSRGRHTTARRELVALPFGGALIDTPGMRELQLWAGEESVDAAFGDILSIAERCRFRDCSHSGERGCAVQAALQTGEIEQARWENYRKLLAEARRHEALADPLAGLERKRRWKQIHKQVREIYKFREKP